MSESVSTLRGLDACPDAYAADAARAESLAVSARHVRRIISWTTVRDALEQKQ